MADHQMEDQMEGPKQVVDPPIEDPQVADHQAETDLIEGAISLALHEDWGLQDVEEDGIHVPLPQEEVDPLTILETIIRTSTNQRVMMNYPIVSH